MNIYFGWFVFGSICVCNKEYDATDYKKYKRDAKGGLNSFYLMRVYSN